MNYDLILINMRQNPLQTPDSCTLSFPYGCFGLSEEAPKNNLAFTKKMFGKFLQLLLLIKKLETHFSLKFIQNINLNRVFRYTIMLS